MVIIEDSRGGCRSLEGHDFSPDRESGVIMQIPPLSSYRLCARVHWCIEVTGGRFTQPSQKPATQQHAEYQ